MSLRPRALASVQGDPREHYTAYRFQGFVLFRDEAHGQRESSCASPDRTETQQKNAKYRRFDARKLASHQTRSLQMKSTVDGHELSPKKHQQHKSLVVSKLEEEYLRSPVQGPTQGPTQIPKVLVLKNINCNQKLSTKSQATTLTPRQPPGFTN